PGFNGSAASSSAGSTTPTTSSASYSSLASLSSSSDFEIGSSSLLKKVFEVSRWATLIRDSSARRTKDSQPSGFGFEYCASHVRFRVFQQTARGPRDGSRHRGRRKSKSAFEAGPVVHHLDA